MFSNSKTMFMYPTIKNKQKLPFSTLLTEFLNENDLFFNESVKEKYGVEEKDDKLVYEILIPGFSKEEISLEVENRKLKVTGKKEKESFIKNQTQVFLVPESYDVSKMEASLKDGVLSIFIEKKENYTTKIEIK